MNKSTRRLTVSSFHRAPKPAFKAPTLADVLLVAGQRLRASETATATTFSLTYAAKHAQARGGAR